MVYIGFLILKDIKYLFVWIQFLSSGYMVLHILSYINNSYRELTALFCIYKSLHETTM